MPAAPDGLYFRRLDRELQGVALSRPSRERDIFELIRTEEAIKKIEEVGKFATYRRLGKRWNELF